MPAVQAQRRVIVAHPAQQHSFRTAEAVAASGAMLTYVTTVYDRPGSLTRLGKRLLRPSDRERADTRSSGGIRNEDVRQLFEWAGLLLLILRRVDRSNVLYKFWDACVRALFNWRLAAYVSRVAPDMVILYDAVSLGALHRIRKSNPQVKCVLDVSAPAAPYVFDVLYTEAKRNPRRRANLIKEFLQRPNQRLLDSCARELELADAFLSASDFTTRSLVHAGVSPQKIYKCRYGIGLPAHQHDCSRGSSVRKLPLKFIYVGRVIDQKGVYYLFEAFREIGSDIAQLQVLGQYSAEDGLYTDYRDEYDYRGNVTRSEVLARLRSADVAVFPSLADGFGMAVVEALACGVPVICSENAGASELIEQGVNGFVVPAADADAIRQAALWFCRHPESLESFSVGAAASIKTITWASYNQDVARAMEAIIGT